jgi:hypothetical protein
MNSGLDNIETVKKEAAAWQESRNIILHESNAEFACLGQRAPEIEAENFAAGKAFSRTGPSGSQQY